MTGMAGMADGGGQAMGAQLHLRGMPQRLFSCTPSRLTTWIDCPRHYRMKYVDRPRPVPGPAWAHNSLGASVHNALAGWWRLPRRQRTPQAVGQLLDAAWSAEGFRDAEQSRAWQARSKEVAVRYVATLDPDTEPVGVERTLGTRTRRLALSGRVDRLDDRGGQLVVVDYKTGRRSPTADEARGSLALALYALTASATLRRPCRRVELHHVPTGEVQVFEHTQESIERQVRRSEAIADEIVAAGTDPADTERFPARTGPQCGWCSLRAHCPEGQSAGPAHQPWDGLAD